MTLLAVSRGDVADYLSTLLLLYMILIIAAIVISWFPRIPYNTALRAVTGFVEDITGPYLRLFRRFIPLVRIGPGALDLSPIVAILVLQVVGGLLVAAVRG